MNSIKGFSNQKYLKTNVNFSTLGILLFTLSFSTMHTFIYNRPLLILLLSLSIIILLFSKILNKDNLYLSVIDLLWVLFLWLFIINIVYIKTITPIGLIDILVYSAAVLYLLLVKVNIKHFTPSLKLIKIFALVYSISAIFQYMFTDVYLSIILPLFPTDEQINIRWLLLNNGYSGFTNQTAHTAGYIVNGIGIVLFFSVCKNKKSINFLSIIALIVLFFGLFLASKRAHLIFTIISIVVTYIISRNNKVTLKKVSKSIIGLIVFATMIILLFNILKFDNDSPVVLLFNDIEETVYGILEGEDVSSGRSILYEYSLELFAENPIFGIGWRGFYDNSIGLINNDKGSHPHNIYIQLLTELGLVGYFLFLVPMIYIYYKTYRLLKYSVRNIAVQEWKSGLQFSLYLQTFFVLYGITGNLLTDYNFLLMYFFACSISLSAMYFLRKTLQS